MKIVGTVLLLLIGSFPALSQDCTPCIGVNKLLITNALDPNDTLSLLNSGTQVGLYVRIDDAEILGISEDFTRLLEFTDSNKGDLLRKGRIVENMFEGYIIRAADSLSRWETGIDIGSARVSHDGHILYLDVSTLAQPSSGSQHIYLEGQVGVNVSTDLTREVLVKNVNLSQNTTSELVVEDHTIRLTYVRSEENGPVTSHIFSYSSDNKVIGVSESASRSDSDELSANELRVSRFDNLEMMVELANSELREIPFTLTFGLGL